MEDSKIIYECKTCGYKGENEEYLSHSCTDVLLKIIENLKKNNYLNNAVISEQLAYMQSTYIEWKRGGGANEAMKMIQKRLGESENIPDLNTCPDTKEFYNLYSSRFNRNYTNDS